MIWNKEERTVDNLWMGFTHPHHNAYQTGALQHLFATNVRKAVGVDTYRDFYTFSMVRNPWDRTVSQYLYLFKRPDLQQFLGCDDQVSFREYLQLIQRTPHVHWQAQHLFLNDERGKLMVDYIARFEDYQSSVETIMESIHYPKDRPRRTDLEIPHLNRSKRKPYYYYYAPETAQLVANIYAQDITQFGYTFEDPRPAGVDRTPLPFPIDRTPIAAPKKTLLDRMKRKLSRLLHG
ncbi:hypothetical protein A3850_003870 [Lewinella sp. 4G2]|nr:hypothetical protein A3850_003870 [Lewinella sp. 4G2]